MILRICCRTFFYSTIDLIFFFPCFCVFFKMIQKISVISGSWMMMTILTFHYHVACMYDTGHIGMNFFSLFSLTILLLLLLFSSSLSFCFFSFFSFFVCLFVCLIIIIHNYKSFVQVFFE